MNQPQAEPHLDKLVQAYRRAAVMVQAMGDTAQIAADSTRRFVELERETLERLRWHEDLLSVVSGRVDPARRKHLEDLSTRRLEACLRALPEPSLNDRRAWRGRLPIPGPAGRVRGVRLLSFLLSPPLWYRAVAAFENGWDLACRAWDTR